MDECKSCGKDMDRQGTHWDGCHDNHPECAAFKAGREAGMREAANLCGSVVVRGDIVTMELTARRIADAILSAIGGDK